MLYIEIKDGETVDRALKRFKKKFEKTGVMRELRGRQAFIKPSITHRQQFIKAAYRTKMQLEAAGS
jgi:small subunit ribosomal protein S21